MGGRLFRGKVLSPGRASGVAVRVEIDKEITVPRGAILLLPHLALTSAYTFVAKAAGVVVKQGGLLSHIAVVAREFGVPVVRVDSEEFWQIAEGKRVRIDGGEVYVEDE